ncbi:MAG: hypothetical protein JO048_00315 [Methylobacteriaceae bacterium]|nr:hypothetical protein [Methylobacteriaceae bacterium]
MRSRVFQRRKIEVPCTVEIEHTAESLHAHVELMGAEAEPGDEVIVHGAPATVPFGEKLFLHCRATVIRAGVWSRMKARLEGYGELTELFEVSFSSGRAA